MGTTAWSDTLNSDANNQTSREWRFITVALLAGGTTLTVRLRAASAATFSPDFVSVGIWSGSGYVTTATPVQLLFSGSASFSISNGATITSDPATLTTTTSDKLVLIYDAGSTVGNANPAQRASGANITGDSAVYTGASYQAYDKATPTGTFNDGGTALLAFDLVTVDTPGTINPTFTAWSSDQFRTDIVSYD